MAQQRTLADNVRHWRHKRGMSQGDLYKTAGVSRTTLTDIEQGRTRKPAAWVLARLAKALGVQVEQLMGAE